MKITAFDFIVLLLQVVLISFKIDGTISLSWGLIFIPAYIYIGIYLFLLILGVVAIKKRERYLNEIHKKFFGVGIDEDDDFNDDIF